MSLLPRWPNEHHARGANSRACFTYASLASALLTDTWHSSAATATSAAAAAAMRGSVVSTMSVSKHVIRHDIGINDQRQEGDVLPVCRFPGCASTPNDGSRDGVISPLLSNCLIHRYCRWILAPVKCVWRDHGANLHQSNAKSVFEAQVLIPISAKYTNVLDNVAVRGIGH